MHQSTPAQDAMIVARNQVMLERRCSVGQAMSILARKRPELLEAARAEASEAARHPSQRRAA